MTLGITQSATAVCPYIRASFAASGGTEPYVFSILPSGAGGSINASTGFYTAPGYIQENPALTSDTIRVTDAALATADASILVGSPLLLFCEILQRELTLAAGRVYLWDQKIMQPKDSGLYIAVSETSCKPFGNTLQTASVPMAGLNAEQFISMHSSIDVDIISRGPAARDRKAEVLMALNSIYSRQQQDANSFYIAQIPTNFLNLSHVDGTAIPYRYKISIVMQYAQPKVKPAPYFDDFSEPEVNTDPYYPDP